MGTQGSGFPGGFFPAPRCCCVPATAGPRPCEDHEVRVDSTWTFCGVTARSGGISWCPKEPERKNELLPWLWRGRMSPGARPRLAHPSPAQRPAVPKGTAATKSHPGGTESPIVLPPPPRTQKRAAARGTTGTVRWHQVTAGDGAGSRGRAPPFALAPAPPRRTPGGNV